MNAALADGTREYRFLYTSIVDRPGDEPSIAKDVKRLKVQDQLSHNNPTYENVNFDDVTGLREFAEI